MILPATKVVYGDWAIVVVDSMTNDNLGRASSTVL